MLQLTRTALPEERRHGGKRGAPSGGHHRRVRARHGHQRFPQGAPTLPRLALRSLLFRSLWGAVSFSPPLASTSYGIRSSTVVFGVMSDPTIRPRCSREPGASRAASNLGPMRRRPARRPHTHPRWLPPSQQRPPCVLPAAVPSSCGS